MYRNLSNNSSQTVARKIRHLVAIRIGRNKMSDGDEYWNIRVGGKVLERFIKGVFRDEMADLELSKASTTDR